VDITEGNINDSTAFDSIYAKTVERFPEVKAVTMDAGYKTPWICKKVIDDGRIPSLSYKRPSGKKGFLRTYDYVYDEYYNCVIVQTIEFCHISRPIRKDTESLKAIRRTAGSVVTDINVHRAVNFKRQYISIYGMII